VNRKAEKSGTGPSAVRRSAAALSRFTPGCAVVLPLLTSLLLVLSYPEFNRGWLAWFALAPLSAGLWKIKTPGKAAFAGLLSGFFFYAGILYWIYPTMRAGGVTPPVSAFGLAALSLIMSSEFALMALFGFYLKKAGHRVWPYVFSLGWALMEYGKVLLSLKAVWFPWFMLGYTQWEYPALIQVVSVTGIYGLSAAICFTGALSGALLAGAGRRRAGAAEFAPAVLALALIWGYGRHELAAASASVPSRHFRAVLLQPCIDLYDKWDAAKAGGVRLKIETLLDGVSGTDLVLWPENALPGWIDDPFYAGWLKSLSLKHKNFSIVGSVSRGDGRFVSAFLLNGEGEITAAYEKRRLVPFGEYVPFRGLLGKFVRPVASLGEFTGGPLEQRLFRYDGLLLGGAICYESVFPYLFARDVRAGADVFFNITNDGWYLDTAAPYQHFLVNIFRAVETRRPVIRAANNGISAVIDPWGRVSAKKGLDEYGVLAAKVPVYSSPGLSFYTERGAWFAYVCMLPVSAFLLAIFLI
jgi:apolipoprotein N-acyltransferase